MKLPVALVLALAPTLSAQTQIPLPSFSSTYSSPTQTRGFYFQTPVDITITGLRVPDEGAAGVQCVEVSNLGAAPPTYPAIASGGQVFYANNVPSGVVIPCSLNFTAGSWIGVMGACGTATMNSSYSANGPFNTTIAGQPVSLTRFLTQTNLNSGGNQPYSGIATGAIGRVEVYYNEPPLTAPVPLPVFASTYSDPGGTRGFYFQTPVPIVIRGLRVPDESHDGTQNVEVTRMAAAPPAWPATAIGGQVFYANNVPSYRIIPCNLPFQAGDWVGVLGACGTTTMQSSYGNGPFVSTIAGTPVTLTRFNSQSNLNAGGNQPYSSYVGTLARVEVYYEVATGVATADTYGLGCNRRSRAFYELFSPSASFDLTGTAMRLTPTGGRYVASAAGTYVVPPVSATSLVLGDDTDTLVNLASAFAYPGGVTASLRVCSNGFVSVGAGNGTAFSVNSADWLAGAVARWGDWHDFNPTAPGSGQVKFHESGNLSYVTWDGVFNFGAAASPNTWQLQFNRATGTVTYVWQAMTLGGNAHCVGHAPGAPTPPDDGSIDISALLPGGFGTSAVDLHPLGFQASARPVIGTNIGLVTTGIPVGSPFGATMLGFQQMNSSLAGLGAPTCSQYVNSLSTNLFFIGGTSANVPFLVPNNPYLLGVVILGQSATYTPGANALNVLFSNGLRLGLDLL